MEDATLLVSRNLRRIREEKKLSLDHLAELTGVSKSMLGQIERGDSSPTISTVWKIATGLKISFTSLLTVPQADTSIVKKTQLKPFVEDDGKYRLYPLFPIEDGRKFEIYSVEILRGGHRSSAPHSPGTQEFLTVYSGELTLRIDDEEFRIEQGNSIRFRADRPHAYLNRGQVMTRLSLVINYQE